MKHVYTSIDIGSDTIRVVVCELIKNRLNLLAASSVKSNGVRKGLVTNVDDATVCIKKAINEVEQVLGIKVKKIIASIPSYFSEYLMIQGEVNITSEDNTVTGDDIGRVLNEATKTKNLNGKEMVTIMPIDFMVDGNSLKDPKGFTGEKLGVRAILVTTPKKNIYSVLNILDSLGLEVVDISLNCIGDLYAFKNKSFEDKIGAIINIGSETTNVSIYNKGIVVKNSILQIGGKNIDNDLAYMYKIDNNICVKIKEKFALANKKNASTVDYYQVDDLKISQFEATEIIEARLEEILNLAKKEINVLTNKEINYIIVTGGTTNMAQFSNTLDNVFDKKATIGNVRLVGLRNNKYSSCIGNIIYFISKIKLRGKEYSMISKNDSEELTSTKSKISLPNEATLGKLFEYFFGE